MITRLVIENFKAIKGRQEVEVRPITLLFGPNSGGKSTIIHTLHYVRHILERKDPNSGPILDARGDINLGGFSNLVHGLDQNLNIVLGVEFKLPEDPLARVGTRLNPKADSAALTFTIGRPSEESPASLLQVCVDINGERLAKFNPSYTEGERPEPCYIQWNHPIFLSVASGEESTNWFMRHLENVLGERDEDEELKNPIGIRIDTWLHDIGNPARVAPGTLTCDGLEWESNEVYNLVEHLTPLIASPIEYLRAHLLGEFGHIGPLRVVPSPRQITTERVLDEATNWYSGIAAWDKLLDPRGLREIQLSGLVDNVERMLRLMDAGIDIRVTTYREFEDNHREREIGVLSDEELPPPGKFEGLLHLSQNIENFSQHELAELVNSLRAAAEQLPERQRLVFTDVQTGTEVEPRNFGVGISQLVPVIVGLASRTPALIAIEQPELHIHPRLQVRLGDIVIAAVQREGGQPSPRVMLIETHSEHLLLRLLRRIRQWAKQRDEALNAQPADLPEFRLDPVDLAVIYIDKVKSDSQDGERPVRIRKLRVDGRGEFIDVWPDGFFDERAEELFS